MEMFRQIAPQGIVNKEPVARRVSPTRTANRTATPEKSPQPDESTDILQPVAYKSTDTDAVQHPKIEEFVQSKVPITEVAPEIQDVEPKILDQQSLPDGPADLPRVSRDNAKNVENGHANENLSESTMEPKPELILQCPFVRNMRQPVEASLTDAIESSRSDQQTQAEQQQQPAMPAYAPTQPAESELDRLNELEQWHEASDIIDTAPGCEPEKFHDAVEIDHETSTASSEAGSWTAVTPPASDPPTPRRSTYSSSITSASEQGQASSQASPTEGFFQQCPAHKVHPHPKDMEKAVSPEPGEGVAAAPDSEEARLTHLEMSKISSFECPFLMNRE